MSSYLLQLQYAVIKRQNSSLQTAPKILGATNSREKLLVVVTAIMAVCTELSRFCSLSPSNISYWICEQNGLPRVFHTISPSVVTFTALHPQTAFLGFSRTALLFNGGRKISISSSDYKYHLKFRSKFKVIFKHWSCFVHISGVFERDSWW